MSFFLGTQERIQNSRGKRAISVRASEVLLYISCLFLLGVLCKANHSINEWC